MNKSEQLVPNSCVPVNDLIKVCAQLVRISPKSSFTSGDKLEMNCEQPRHLTQHTLRSNGNFIVQIYYFHDCKFDLI